MSDMRKADPIVKWPIRDAGTPVILPDFLEAKYTSEHSAAKLINSQLRYGNVLAKAIQAIGFLLVDKKRKALARQARSLRTGPEIVAFAQLHEDIYVQHALLQAARKHQGEVAEALFPALPKSQDDCLFEFAVFFFFDCRESYVERLMKTVTSCTFAYGVSILALLISILDRDERGLQLVWDLYNHWLPDYEETLAQGPLFGLWHYSGRRFKSS